MESSARVVEEACFATAAEAVRLPRWSQVPRLAVAPLVVAFVVVAHQLLAVVALEHSALVHLLVILKEVAIPEAQGG